MSDPLTLSPIIAWVGALSLLLNFGLSLWGLLASGSRDNRVKIDDHDARLTRLDARLTSIEASMRAMPAREDLHKIELSLVRMEGEISAMGQRLEPVAAIADRLQELLLQQSQAKR